MVLSICVAERMTSSLGHTCSVIFMNYIHIEIYSVFSIRKPSLKILIANHGSEMAFPHMREVFRPITRDLSTHTTDFIQHFEGHSVQKYLYF